MAIRKASAQWNGGLKGGNGTMALGSGAWEGAYTFGSRFEDDRSATNPEELIGAAHAGCYSMQLSSMLEAAGTAPDYVRTEADVELRAGEEGPRIAAITLRPTGRVPGIDAATFEQTAQDAKQACLVTRALAGVAEVTIEPTFEES